MPVGDCCVGGWVRPLADNTILLHLSELETGGASNHKNTRATPGSFASNIIRVDKH